MPLKRVYNLKGLNLYTSPLLKQSGELLRCLNVVSEPYGAKTKRPGYITYLGTADGSAPTTLFSWQKDGTTLYTYRASGSKLYYSTNGTGAWTVCGNGTISPGAYVGHAVLGDTLIVGDGVGSTRHTTTGVSFSNTSLAPVSAFFEQYQNRIYAAGTEDVFYSSTGEATDWATSGTSDSSSFRIPGGGTPSVMFKSSDRLVINKSIGEMYRWDGYSLVDMATKQGPSSPYSVASSEGYQFYLNNLGIFGYGGGRPQLISNAVQPQIYNNAQTGIVGATFGTAPAGIHRYDYYLAAGTVTDDLAGYTIPDALIKYDYQKNEFSNFQYYNFPTAFHSFRGTAGNERFIFGATGGQCYEVVGTAVTDNGSPIEARIELVEDMDAPEVDKEFRWLTLAFSPGCQAQVSVAIQDTYSKDEKDWIELGTAENGVLEYRFPASDSRGKLLFIKIYEASRASKFSFYGYTVDADFAKD